ncbi:MAG: hypothetical protein K9H64_04910 [Bacteroidales bacterium]|nr:hypothetical protein [Bacteroidales bacterium]MCF8455177.1 hypothetical protein [Bacteroidales bacterium]
MAVVKKNIITEGLSGMLGHSIVFRNVGSRTIVASRPSVNDNPSDAQVASRTKFHEAVIYAKAQMEDATSKAEYAAHAEVRRMPSAYTVAIADFYHAPDIKDVDLSAYSGAVNDKIGMIVTDDFKVAKVEVVIFNPDGPQVEGGEAAFVQGNQWEYTATVANPDPSGAKIIIRAYDRPGNVAESESNLQT